MYHPTIFLDPQFTVGVMAGWLLEAAKSARCCCTVWFSCAGVAPPDPGATAFALAGLRLVVLAGSSGSSWALADRRPQLVSSRAPSASGRRA
jgi:hypothetical protein